MIRVRSKRVNGSEFWLMFRWEMVYTIHSAILIIQFAAGLSAIAHVITPLKSQLVKIGQSFGLSTIIQCLFVFDSSEPGLGLNLIFPLASRLGCANILA